MAEPNPIVAAAARAFARRATALRQEAAEMSTTVADPSGRPVPIVPPEARVKLRTADVFDEIAADVIATPTRT